MKFNLNLLKFHSFKFNKNFTNYIDSKYSWDKFWENLNKKIIHMKQHKYKSFTNYLTGKHDHFIDEQSFNYLYKNIITICHPNLRNELDQLMENINYKEKKIHENFCQFHIDSKSKEVIFAFISTINNQEEIFPLILDMNHCITKVSNEKSYSYKYHKFWKEWDWKKNQNFLKKDLLEKKIPKFN